MQTQHLFPEREYQRLKAKYDTEDQGLVGTFETHTIVKNWMKYIII